MMTERDLLPHAFTAPLVAKLLKTTPQLLAELTAAGGIAALPGEGWRRYSRDEIEKVLGRPLTLADWIEAEAAHALRKAAHARYNAKRGSLTLTRRAA